MSLSNRVAAPKAVGASSGASGPRPQPRAEGAAPKSEPGRFVGSASEADGIFLSPRVIDRRAFNDYAHELRRLLDRASSQATVLQTVSAEAAAAREGLEKEAGAVKTRLGALSKLLETVHTQSGEARSLLTKVSDAGRSAVAAHETLESVATEHITRAESRAQQIAEKTDAAFDELERRLASIVAGAEERATALESELNARLETFESSTKAQAAEIDKQIVSARRRIKRLEDRVKAADVQVHIRTGAQEPSADVS